MGFNLGFLRLWDAGALRAKYVKKVLSLNGQLSIKTVNYYTSVARISQTVVIVVYT